MSDDRVTRRKFMHDGAAAAAGMAAALSAAKAAAAAGPETPKSKVLNYNENMEYRRLGKTGLMIGAIALGGHWKQVSKVVPRVLTGKGWLSADIGNAEFRKNRHDVVSACIDAGMNYIDACTGAETMTYAEALRGRRDKMYLGYSWYEHEMRFKDWQTEEKLLKSLNEGLWNARLSYFDLWRITCYWRPNDEHSEAHEHAIVGALEKARKAGKVRFCGLSTHKQDWTIHMMKTFPKTIEVVVIPYTAGSKDGSSRSESGAGSTQPSSGTAQGEEESSASLIAAVKKNNVGWFGIKPFASGSVFRSGGVPDSSTKADDDERARLALRNILRSNDALTAPIPGLITVDQVKNAVRAVAERRQFDHAEARKYDEAVREMWANLPEDYQWLKEWEWV